MKLRFPILLPIFLAFAVGCQDAEKSASLTSHLTDLSKTFGIAWPSNRLDEHAGAQQYRAYLDGDSKNTVTVARFGVSSPDFESWRTGVTNIIKEYIGFGWIEDPRLVKSYEWWDGHRHLGSRFDYYLKEIDRGPTYLAKLEIYVTPAGDQRIFYVHAHVLTR